MLTYAAHASGRGDDGLPKYVERGRTGPSEDQVLIDGGGDVTVAAVLKHYVIHK